MVAVSWEKHRRTTELCDALTMPLFTLVSRRRGGRRYAKLIYETVRLLWKERPSLLLVQNPSVVLTSLALVASKILGYRLVVDAHNEAITPFVHSGKVIQRVAEWLLRSADLTIVTNEQLSKKVKDKGGRAFVLPDRLPRLEATPPPPLRSGEPLRIMVVCTYAPDEPIESIVEAASILGPAFQFYITGQVERAPPTWRCSLPQNVVATGYISDEAYVNLMQSAHVVLDITTMPDCLVCGAYEGLAIGRPLILSDSKCNHELFAEVATYADNSGVAIARAIEVARSHYQALCEAIPNRRRAFECDWRKRELLLREVLLRLSGE